MQDMVTYQQVKLITELNFLDKCDEDSIEPYGDIFCALEDVRDCSFSPHSLRINKIADGKVNILTLENY